MRKLFFKVLPSFIEIIVLVVAYHLAGRVEDLVPFVEVVPLFIFYHFAAWILHFLSLVEVVVAAGRFYFTIPVFGFLAMVEIIVAFSLEQLPGFVEVFHPLIEVIVFGPAHLKYRNPNELYNYVLSKTQDVTKRYYVFIDEIQLSFKVKNEDVDESLVPEEDREMLYTTFYDILNDLMGRSNLDVYVTGSNI